jgi:hypothetical protein
MITLEQLAVEFVTKGEDALAASIAEVAKVASDSLKAMNAINAGGFEPYINTLARAITRQNELNEATKAMTAIEALGLELRELDAGRHDKTLLALEEEKRLRKELADTRAARVEGTAGLPADELARWEVYKTSLHDIEDIDKKLLAVQQELSLVRSGDMDEKIVKTEQLKTITDELTKAYEDQNELLLPTLTAAVVDPESLANAKAATEATEELRDVQQKRLELAAQLNLVESGGYDEQLRQAKLLKIEEQELADAKEEAFKRMYPRMALLKPTQEEYYAKGGPATDAERKQHEAEQAGKKKSGAGGTQESPLAKGAATTVASLKLVDVAAVAATVKIMGYATASLQASAQGQMLQFQVARLGQNFSGLLRPEVMRITELLGKFSSKMETATNAQRESWSMALQGGLAYKTTSVALGTFLPILGPIPTMLTALGVGLLTSRGGFNELTKAGSPFAELIKSLAHLFTATVDAIMPVVEVLGGALVPIINTLADVIEFLSGLITTNTVILAASVGVFFMAKAALMALAAVHWTTLIPAIMAWIKAQITALSLMGPVGWTILAGAVGVAAAAFVTLGSSVNGVGSSMGGTSREIRKLTRELAEATTEMNRLEELSDALEGKGGIWEQWKKNVESGAKAQAEKAKGLQKQLDEAQKKGQPDRGKDTMKLGGPENIEATWMRIMQRSRLIGGGGPAKSTDEEILDETKEQKGIIGELFDHIKRFKWPFGA